MKKRYTLLGLAIFIIIAIDQIIKLLVVNGNFAIESEIMQYIKNFGGAFGIGGNSTILFILIDLVICGIIIKFIYSQKDRIDTKTLSSFTLILAGGFSNLIDRIFRGCVIDYIKIGNFPAFNIADVSIVIGCIMLFACIINYWYKETKATKK